MGQSLLDTPIESRDVASPIELKRAHVINLARRPDRLQRFSQHLQQDLGWKMELLKQPAVDTSDWPISNFANYVTPAQVAVIDRGYRTEHADLTRGAVGCSLSHAALWALLATNPQWDHMLIFEDDACWRFHVRLTEAQLATMINGVRPDWDILLLGCYPKEVLEDHGWWLSVNFFHCTHSYIVRRSALPKLLQNFFPLEKQLDSMISGRIKPMGLRVYTLTPFVFDQTWADTNVQTPLVIDPKARAW